MHFLDTFQVTNASFGRKAVYDGEQIEEVENNAIPMEDLNQPNDGTIHFAGNEKYFHNLLYISSIMSFFFTLQIRKAAFFNMVIIVIRIKSSLWI